ncbi:unnamed protein product [Gongylonema pulchrum]|uniref:G_PROTEIN_RECEP_F1_2 domain-containing protein n=1 Tax=Gongylonema pulchrum TaxID=637853 RepID=A0A183CUG3_9BILA|nr:unnamed protein product [Gongylonema pulchrum]
MVMELVQKCRIAIGTNLLVIVVFNAHAATLILCVLESVVVLFILLLLIAAITLARRDLLCFYMIGMLLHGLARVLVGAVAALTAIYPRGFIQAARKGHRITYKMARVVWACISVISILLWLLAMTAIYFALRYRHYIPRYGARREHRRIKAPVLVSVKAETAPTAGTDSSTAPKTKEVPPAAINTAQSPSGKDAQLASGKETQQASGKDTQIVSGKELQNTTPQISPKQSVKESVLDIEGGQKGDGKQS